MDRQSVAETQSRVQLAEEEAQQARRRALAQEEEVEQHRAALKADSAAKAAQLQSEFDKRVADFDDQAAQKQAQLTEQQQALVWPKRHIFQAAF